MKRSELEKYLGKKRFRYDLVEGESEVGVTTGMAWTQVGGDTLFIEKLFGIAEYKPDYTFICINGRLGNMNVKEALITAEKIGAAVNIPNHYDMFLSSSEDPLLFSKNIKGGFVMEFKKEYLFL